MTTATGPKAIETIQVGDSILVANDETGAVSYRPVLQTFRAEDRPVVELVLEPDDGRVDRFQVAPNHPFLARGRGWLPVSDLLAGDEVLSLEGGWLRVGSARWVAVNQSMFNLEVEELHTYFVGETAAWVHDQNCSKIAPRNRLGYPVVDEHARFDTHIHESRALLRDRDLHMRAATRNLRLAIQRGRVSESAFTRKQLVAIRRGEGQSPGLTWHHHQQYRRMQLLPEAVHSAAGNRHTGGFKTWYQG